MLEKTFKRKIEKLYKPTGIKEDFSRTGKAEKYVCFGCGNYVFVMDNLNNNWFEIANNKIYKDVVKHIKLCHEFEYSVLKTRGDID